MVSLHITGKTIDAEWMSEVKVSDVAEYFNFPVTKDVPVMPAVYQTVEVRLCGHCCRHPLRRPHRAAHPHEQHTYVACLPLWCSAPRACRARCTG